MARSMNLRRAVATATALLGLLVVGTGGSAHAAVQARVTSASTSVTSGSWAVVPAPSGAATPAAAPLTLGFTALTHVLLFEAVNTGTLAVTAASYNVVVGPVTLQAPTVVLEACVGGTWTNTTTCTATVTKIGTSWTPADSAKFSASPAAPAAAGSRLHIRATLSGVLLVTPTVTVNISVASGPTRQIRTALVTNG
ncbi:MAG: hypothetical protein JWN87_1907 [Frankiales bacterium]|jgi:hypothetical protein|nr:hypothetical protein [Frankiales bacterium]